MSEEGSLDVRLTLTTTEILELHLAIRETIDDYRLKGWFPDSILVLESADYKLSTARTRTLRRISSKAKRTEEK